VQFPTHTAALEIFSCQNKVPLTSTGKPNHYPTSDLGTYPRLKQGCPHLTTEHGKPPILGLQARRMGTGPTHHLPVLGFFGPRRPNWWVCLRGHLASLAIFLTNSLFFWDGTPVIFCKFIDHFHNIPDF